MSFEKIDGGPLGDDGLFLVCAAEPWEIGSCKREMKNRIESNQIKMDNKRERATSQSWSYSLDSSSTSIRLSGITTNRFLLFAKGCAGAVDGGEVVDVMGKKVLPPATAEKGKVTGLLSPDCPGLTWTTTLSMCC